MVAVTVAGEVIESTGHHPWWVVRGEALGERPQPEHVPGNPAAYRGEGRWVDAIDLRVGDVLLLRSGEQAPVTSLVVRHARLPVYNFQVEDLHCYAVGHAQILVHNNSFPTDAAGRQAMAGNIVASGFKKTTQRQSKNDAAKIERMAEDMKNGNFDWSKIKQHEKILVDQDGVVMNGNHRVIAAALAGKPIPADQIVKLPIKTVLESLDWIDTIPIKPLLLP